MTAEQYPDDWSAEDIAAREIESHSWDAERTELTDEEIRNLAAMIERRSAYRGGGRSQISETDDTDDSDDSEEPKFDGGDLYTGFDPAI